MIWPKVKHFTGPGTIDDEPEWIRKYNFRQGIARRGDDWDSLDRIIRIGYEHGNGPGTFRVNGLGRFLLRTWHDLGLFGYSWETDETGPKIRARTLRRWFGIRQKDYWFGMRRPGAHADEWPRYTVRFTTWRGAAYARSAAIKLADELAKGRPYELTLDSVTESSWY